MQSHRQWKTTYQRIVLFLLIAALICGIYIVSNAHPARAAACVPPATDYGTVTQTINIAQADTYRVWTRMAAPNSSDNIYMLEVDGTECYVVGGDSVPVYANPSGPYFVSDGSNWISRTESDALIDVTLSSGNHTFEMIGQYAGVVVDRLLVTQDAACSPTGTGDNCATEYFVADINEDGNINFLDFSLLASQYGQSGGSIGRPDINRDTTVNFLDFSLLSSRYGS